MCAAMQNFLRVSGICCLLEVDGVVPEAAFDLARRRSLFLAIKVALNNAAKYSGETEVLLEIHLEKDEIRHERCESGNMLLLASPKIIGRFWRNFRA